MARTVLVGRDLQLEALQNFCRRADPSAASLLLTGNLGIGKSALLRAVADWAADEGFCVLRANGARSEAGTAYSLLNQLLLPLEHRLPGLEADAQQPLAEALGLVDGSGPDRSALAPAVSSLLRLAAADHPVLLVVDDLQWVDQATAQVLGLLIPQLGGSGTRFIGACRSHDPGFFGARLTPCTSVLPLEPVAAAELVSRQHPHLDPRLLSRVLAQSGGNPLALVELPRVLAGESDLRQQPGADRLLSRPVAHSFTLAIQELPAATRRLLLLVALEGTGDLSFVAPSTALELRPAEQAGLVSVDLAARRLAFTHPLTALVVLGLATSDDRRTAHRELAHLLVGRPERQLLHLAEATTGPDEAVAAQLEAGAALSARSGDDAAAVAAGLRAAALSASPAQRARRLAHAAYRTVAAAGDVPAGLHLLDEATRADPAVASSLRYAMASAAAALHGRGDADTAHRVLMSAFAAHLLHPDGDRETLLEAARDLLDLCRWSQRPEHWDSLSGVVRALGSGEGVRAGRQLATLPGPVRAAVGAFAPIDAELEQLRTDASAAPASRVADGALAAGTARYRQHLAAVVADGRARDGSAAALEALCCLAEEAYLTGDWDEAEALVDQGLSWCSRLGCQLRAWRLRWVKALVAAGRGGLPAVRQSTEEMLQWAERHGIGRVRTYAHHARALGALGSGAYERAYQEATAIAPADRRTPGPESLDPALCRVEAALRTSRGDEAARQATAIRGTTTGGAATRVALLLAASAAMAAPEQDRGPLYERALAVPGSAQYPFDLARLHLAYGQHLRRSRSTTTARQHLRTALDTFERLDASPWVEQARIELDATGETRQVEPGRFLTPQERTVASLAASGHTNKQVAEKLFLTHRTVSAHLHQVFRKLGVDSRAGLRDALDGQAPGLPAQRSLLSQRAVDHHGDGRRRTPRAPVTASLAPR